MGSPSEEVVGQLLRARADRGVFRSFAVRRLHGKLSFSFAWLREQPFRLVFDARRNTLEFRNLLPNLPAREPMYKDLRSFLKSRCDTALPEHRRADPSRVQLRARNRKGSVSVFLESLDGDWDYAVARALKLANEIFLSFLRGPYHEYMVDNFGEPED